MVVRAHRKRLQAVTLGYAAVFITDRDRGRGRGRGSKRSQAVTLGYAAVFITDRGRGQVNSLSEHNVSGCGCVVRAHPKRPPRSSTPFGGPH
ncbi:hypothetical protein J6590_019206 [Homalodisca vitripennis]|nr:hypothetical protein J6590_019206 [Homalodisca vitripennis]